MATEESFLSLVERQWHSRPQIASAGTCCLVGIICNGMIYIANVGDSRVVLGRAERATHEVRAVQLSAEHNASIQSVREELQAMHPYDSQIVVLKHKVWRVKGLIQVNSRFLCFIFNIPKLPKHLMQIYFPFLYYGSALDKVYLSLVLQKKCLPQFLNEASTCM